MVFSEIPVSLEYEGPEIINRQTDHLHVMLYFQELMSEMIAQALLIEGIENPTPEDVRRLWNLLEADAYQVFVENLPH